jgi:ABC-2 type transport system ATP-binding protein
MRDHNGEDRSITAQGMRRDFGGLHAVDGVDLEIAGGRIFGFLGPNGAGKSTLVKILTTILNPTAGRATVAGYDVQKQGGKVREAIGVALQDVGLDPLMTARELLMLQSELFGTPRSEARKTAERLLTTVGLDDVDPKKRSGAYSGGMKRRLDLALALVNDPRILFLDEPTTGLDPASRAAIWEEVRRLNDELGMTIFLTTQYLEEARARRATSSARSATRSSNCSSARARTQRAPMTRSPPWPPTVSTPIASCACTSGTPRKASPSWCGCSTVRASACRG